MAFLFFPFLSFPSRSRVSWHPREMRRDCRAASARTGSRSSTSASVRTLFLRYIAHCTLHIAHCAVRATAINATSIITMAAVANASVNDDAGLPPRKKPKVSELPLAPAQRASIDSLLQTFKKKGQFDALRKKTWSQFEEGVCPALVAVTRRAMLTRHDRPRPL